MTTEQHGHVDPERRLGAKMLMRHTRADEAEIKRRQQLHDDRLGAYRSALPQGGLPGLGNRFWQRAQAHLQESSQADELIVSSFRTLDPFLGEPLHPFQLHSSLDKWRIAVEKIGYKLSSAYQMCKFRIHPGPAETVMFGNQPALQLNIVNLPDKWQTGQLIQTVSPTTFFHATRSALVPSILTLGARASPLSHGEVGLWVNSNPDMAWTWTINPLDAFPCVLFRIRADSNQVRRNAAISQGNIHRSVICDPAQGPLPNVQITSIYVKIPSQTHADWLSSFRTQLMNSIVDVCGAQPAHIIALVQTEVWQLTSWRFCYSAADGSQSPDFGGPFNEVSPVSINLSMNLSAFLQALAATSARTRLRHLKKIAINTIPHRLLTWMEAEYPGLRQLLSSPAHIPGIWSVEPRVQVHRWTAVDQVPLGIEAVWL